MLQVKFVVGAKLHKFKDGCARLKPMKSLKVKIKDFWGCIVADVEKWIFDPLVWEWEDGTNLLMYTSNLGRSLWRNVQGLSKLAQDKWRNLHNIKHILVWSKLWLKGNCLHLVF